MKRRHPLQLLIELTIDLVDLALDDCEQFNALACGTDGPCRPLRARCASGSFAADRPPFAGNTWRPLPAWNAWWPLLTACAFGAGHRSKWSYTRRRQGDCGILGSALVTEMTDLPIACTLTPEAIRTRRAGLLPGLLSRIESCETLPEGYRLRFAATGDVLTAIAQTIDAERQCCRFLRFLVTVEPDGGPISLDITGPPGTSEFLDGLLMP